MDGHVTKLLFVLRYGSFVPRWATLNVFLADDVIKTKAA